MRDKRVILTLCQVTLVDGGAIGLVALDALENVQVTGTPLSDSGSALKILKRASQLHIESALGVGIKVLHGQLLEWVVDDCASDLYGLSHHLHVLGLQSTVHLGHVRLHGFFVLLRSHLTLGSLSLQCQRIFKKIIGTDLSSSGCNLLLLLLLGVPLLLLLLGQRCKHDDFFSVFVNERNQKKVFFLLKHSRVYYLSII